MPAGRDDPLGLETAPLTELQRKTGGGWPTRLPPARSMREPYRAHEQLSHARKEVSSLSDKSGHGILPKVPSSDPPPKLSPPRKKAAAAARAAEAAAAAARGDAGEHGGDGEAGEEPWWQSALDGGRRDRGGVDIWQASAEREEEDDPAPTDPADPASDSPPSEARGGPLRKARRAATGAQPSNRSEALLLSRELERRLCAVREPDPLQGGRMMSAYHEEKRVYDTIFRKVVEQVAVHCAERGDLLETLRSFYARSTDTTARMAERSLRAVYDKRLAHAEAEIAFLRQEAEELRNKQVPSSVEHAIMYMFRTLEQRKQQRVLGVLWTEGSRLLMRCEDCETLLPPPEQAEVLNDSLLLHIEPARLDTLTALMAARPLPEQVKLCTMFLASLPEAELLHIVMQVLGPEQQRRLFLSIFDLLETEDEKPRAVIELLQTMQSKDAINLMASVLTSPGAPDFVALVSHALSPALTTEEKCINVLASLLCNAGTETASRAIKMWARQLKKTEGGAPKLEHADSDSDSFDDSSDEDGSPRKSKPDFNLKIKEVFTELLSVGTTSEANFIFEQLMHEMDEKQRAKLLPSLLSNVQRGELSNLIPQILASNMDALLLPAAQVELKSQLAEIGAVASRFASLLLTSLRPQARLESLRHLTSQDVFGDAEIQVLADYLARVAPSFLEQAQAAVVADPLISPRVAKRRTKKDEGAELIPVDHTTHAVAEIIAQKVREDAKADKKAKPRIQMAKFLRDYLLRTYGFKKVADKSGRDLRYSIRHAASSKGPYATRMHIFGQVFNVLSEYPRWPEPKVDFFFALICRCLWYDRTASLQQAAQRRKSRRSSTKDKEPLEEAKPAVKAPTGFSVEGEVVGPTNIKELLQKPLLQVKLPAVHSAIDALVINAEMAASLKGEMDAVSEAEPLQGNDKGQKRVINMDYVLTIMMQSWQQAADKRLAKNNSKLEKLFEETDDNKNGTLEFKEFKALTDRLMNKNSDQLTPVSVMDLFDEAITVSSEKEGEEMDAVTKEAFVEVFARSNLISMEPFAFADAQELARKLFASISAPKALRRTNVISNSNKEGATASQEEAVEVIEKDPRVRAIIKDAVRNNFLFRYLDDDMLNVVVGYMQPLAVRLGHRVIEQGDRGDYFYVAESGAYNVIVNQAHVHTYEVDEERRVFPTFGELALMYAKPRAAGVVANTDGKLWRLGRAGFRQVQAMANSSRPDPTKILRKVEIFDTLRYDQLAGLRDAMWDKTFVEGEYVFKQGDEADGFYLVSSGWAKVIKSVEETTAAQSIEVMTLGPASYFGERALLHKEPRSASVRVESEELHCLFISTQEFENRLGSLSEMIDKSRREREAAAEARMKELEAFGLGSAQRGSFGFEGVITPIIDGQTATERLYLARHLPTGKLYTVRQQLKKGLVDLNAQSRLPKELEILSQINSAGNLNASLATLLRTFLTDGSVFVLFREVAVCDLRLLSDQGVMGDESILRWVAACVVNALHTLHIDHQTLYRNICVDNVYMLDSGYAALMDFRFAKRDDGKCTSLCGPISSVAPETVRGETQTPAVDVWAFGTLLFELFHGDSPWGSCDAEDTMILKRISAHKGALEIPFVSPDLVELCNALLDPIASTRPTIAAVKESAWFGDTQWARMLTGELPSPLHDISKEQASIKLDEGAGSDLVEIPLPPDVDQTWLEEVSAYRFAK
ncbi:hypothetical protein AB1Y20_000452 [Prymnesium parvum]|uniref:cGMP-dependent protein kinase n=1 Tax=Prymnesium parvum TaxID=97485 RepID=A0AB34K5D6_PRYPA